MDRKRARPGHGNIVGKLLCREIGARQRLEEMQFRNLKLQAEFDTFNEDQDPRSRFQKHRSQVIKIIVVREMVFGLTYQQVCAVFHRETNKRICFLNASDEVISDIFYNKKDDCLFTLSSHAATGFNIIRCRVIPLESIKRGQPDSCFPDLFRQVSTDLGRVDFDGVNNKIIAFNDPMGIFKVFDFNFTMLFSIELDNISDIKISPGILTVLYEKTRSGIPLKLVSIEDGSLLGDFCIKSTGDENVDCEADLINQKLLLRQGQNVQTVDLLREDLKSQPTDISGRAEDFAFLHQKQLILSFGRSTGVQLWNLRGELLTKLTDRVTGRSFKYITKNEDFLISYSLKARGVGSICVHKIPSGDCLANICGDDPSIQKSKDIQTPVLHALFQVSTIFYDEEKNEIYTGNAQGFVHVWSN